jgi:predicted phage terminase large subunit-like protein
MTRWHKDDLVGRILANSVEHWEVLSLPAIAENDDALGRIPGEALWDERFPLETLKEIKNESGAFWFSALYQQNPIATEFQIFRPENWLHYNSDPSGYVIQCWDTAQKEGQMNDYSVCTTWHLTDNGYYLSNCWRGKPLYPDLREKVIQLHKDYDSDLILIEDASSGQSLIPDLKRYTRLPIRAVEPSNKVTRAHLVSPLFENKKVFIKNEPWAEEVILEMADFPQGKHDDIVDSVTHALNYIKSIKPERRANLPLKTASASNPMILNKANYFTNY